MKLLQLETHAFRGAPDGIWSFWDAASGAVSPLTVIAGGSASGKTSLLLAIAFVRAQVARLGGPLDYEAVVRAGEVEGEVATTWLLDDDERRVAGVAEPVQRTAVGLGRRALPAPLDGMRRLFRSYAQESRLGKLELFPSNRSLGLHGPVRGSGPLRSDALEAALRASRRADKYYELPAWLLRVASRDAQAARRLGRARGVTFESDVPDSLSGFRRGLAQLAPHLRFDAVVDVACEPTLQFLRDDGRTMAMEDVSDAEEQAILFASAFARIGLHRSVVLVDAPELHLARAQHATWLAAIASLGRDNQIIAATSAPAVIESVRRDRVLWLPAVRSPSALAS